uniref:Extracellular ligand-binding receptor n=1 Tax=Cyanothece sp. (strain PCC 7425 / ATCC 29141) TaxID=395961 RepID=B8HVS6_CYAP4
MKSTARAIAAAIKPSPQRPTYSLLLAIVLLLNSCTPNPPGSDQSPGTGTTSIPLGAALAQTGNASLFGQESITGVKIAETYFNQQGGINGTPIQVILQDTGSDEAGAINAFQTLINTNKVVGIIGPTLSQQAFGADPIAERAQVPVIAASNTAKGIPQLGEYIARVSAPSVMVVPSAIQAALKLTPPIRRVAVFYAQDDAYGRAETEIFQQTIKQQNLDLVTVQKYQTTDTDFQAQATNALNLKPDMIVISGLAADGGNLVRQLRELGYKGLIVGGNGFNTPNIFPVCRSLCDGILVAQAYSPNHDSAINQAFRQAHRQQYQKDPSQFSAQAFTAVQVFVTALKAVDQQNKISQLSLNDLRRQLNRQILQGQYDTPIGAISFTPEGEINQKAVYVAQIKMEPNGQTGQFVFIK